MSARKIRGLTWEQLETSLRMLSRAEIWEGGFVVPGKGVDAEERPFGRRREVREGGLEEAEPGGRKV